MPGWDKLEPAAILLFFTAVIFASGWGAKVIWNKAAKKLEPRPAIIVIAPDSQNVTTAPMRPCYIASIESYREDVTLELSTGRSPFPEIEATLDPNTPIRVNGHSVWPRSPVPTAFPEDYARDFVRIFKAEADRSTRVRIIVRPSQHGDWMLHEGTLETHPREDIRSIEMRNERGVP